MHSDYGDATPYARKPSALLALHGVLRHTEPARITPPEEVPRVSDYVTRMIGAAKLQPASYVEVEAAANALPQAAGVVGLAAIAAGIGALGSGGFGLFIWAIIAALFGWIVWAALTWAIG